MSVIPNRLVLRSTTFERRSDRIQPLMGHILKATHSLWSQLQTSVQLTSLALFYTHQDGRVRISGATQMFAA